MKPLLNKTVFLHKSIIKMTLEQKYKEQYEIGFPIFQKLFLLRKDAMWQKNKTRL